MNQTNTAITGHPLVQGIAVGLLTFIPLMAFLLSAFRSDLFSLTFATEVSLGLLWLTGFFLLVIDRLIEFDFLKGLVKGTLSKPEAASVNDAVDP
jgi:hypothetical protein